MEVKIAPPIARSESQALSDFDYECDRSHNSTLLFVADVEEDKDEIEDTVKTLWVMVRRLVPRNTLDERKRVVQYLSDRFASGECYTTALYVKQPKHKAKVTLQIQEYTYCPCHVQVNTEAKLFCIVEDDSKCPALQLSYDLMLSTRDPCANFDPKILRTIHTCVRVLRHRMRRRRWFNRVTARQWLSRRLLPQLSSLVFAY